ncbi:MAG: PAS domain-containing protein [Deltaproteobacteria bacterium]|nr:PAS domain-containing protein [Deltaproteobacteria bacterium]
MKLSGISFSHVLPWRMAPIVRGWIHRLGGLLEPDKQAINLNVCVDIVEQLSHVIHDVIVQQNKRTEEYQRQKLQLETIINTLSDAIIVTDSQHALIMANPAWYRLFEASPVCLGQPLLHSVRVPCLFEGLSQTQKTGLSNTIDFDYLGRFFKARITKLSTPVFDGCLTVLSDVTQIKIAEQIRRDFTANVSHEMKTPLTSIAGYSETLLMGALDDPTTARNFVKIIHNQSEKLKALIDDVLHLARVESPALKIENKPVVLSQIVNDVISDYREHPKQLVFSSNRFDVTVVSDAQAIRHILHNLIDNAVKYTPSGGSVLVTVRVDSARGVSITVSDTGVGISQNDQRRIFERFYRVGGHSLKDGTGLGLAIVKHLVERLGGTISVDSTVGKGSSFTFSLPQ